MKSRYWSVEVVLPGLPLRSRPPEPVLELWS
jgi:hypothetical protein